jgi:hypothetical protein
MTNASQVIGEIRQLGGTRSADFLSRLLSDIVERENDHEIVDVLNDRIRRICGDDYWDPIEGHIRDSRGYAGGSSINVIPSRGHGGVCTEFCLVDSFSRSHGQLPFFHRRYHSLHQLMHITCANGSIVTR